MTTRRWISIGIAGVLAVLVLVTVVVVATGGGSGSSKNLRVVRGVIGSEKKPYFDDPRVKAEFANAGYNVQVDTAGSRQISTTVNLKHYDFAFPAGTPAAEKISRDHHVTTTYVPFSTPMAVATFKPIAQLLTSAGVAHDNGGWWTLDMKGFLGLASRSARWTDLPNNQAYPASKAILITSTDLSTSNSAAMYAAIASYVANGNNVLADPAQIGPVLDQVSALFVKQGYTEQSSEGPFGDYLSIGIGKTPMVMIYESQFVARAAARDGSIRPDMVLMYPDPDIVSKHTLVPLTPSGDAIGRLVQENPTLQRYAVDYGFRTAKPAAFNDFVARRKVIVAPQLINIIEPPTYDTLEALITKVADAQHAVLGPPPSSATNPAP